MSGVPSAEHELMTSLRRYALFLKERNATLVALFRTSEQVRARLHQDPSVGIDALLEQRERDCTRFSDVAAKQNKADAFVFESLRRGADAAGGEIGELTRSAVELQADYDGLAQQILLCQSECEAIFRQRLEATASALRESVQRRRLDAAYGPACKRRPPVFLDKQQ